LFQACRHRRAVDDPQPVVRRGLAQPQVKDRQLLAQMPASTMTVPAATVSSIVARGKLATSSAGRPSPSWASKLSVPMTP